MDKGVGAILYRIGPALPQRYELQKAINPWILKMTAMILGDGLSRNLKCWLLFGL